MPKKFYELNPSSLEFRRSTWVGLRGRFVKLFKVGLKKDNDHELGHTFLSDFNAQQTSQQTSDKAKKNLTKDKLTSCSVRSRSVSDEAKKFLGNDCRSSGSGSARTGPLRRPPSGARWEPPVEYFGALTNVLTTLLQSDDFFEFQRKGMDFKHLIKVALRLLGENHSADAHVVDTDSGK